MVDHGVEATEAGAPISRVGAEDEGTRAGHFVTQSGTHVDPASLSSVFYQVSLL
jgi:hypothetical protein